MRIQLNLLALLTGASAFVVPISRNNNNYRTQTFQLEAASSRREVLNIFTAGLFITTAGVSSSSAANADEVFGESIAEKALRMSKEVEALEAAEEKVAPTVSTNTQPSPTTTIQKGPTAYDFTLPVAGEDIKFSDLIGQKFPEPSSDTVTIQEAEGEGSETTSATASKVIQKRPRVKAVLVVNIKQDDPIARKNIPEMISLAAKYGKNGDFAVIAVPTDQGYYEPDTSALLRLKVQSEYGYGINPATILTDKINLLGTGAHPFMRWIEGTCRTPAGLGRIEANFEKFLVDATTGLPLRRYPRKYSPADISDDIEAVIQGKPLPPARANYLEQWRSAAVDAERDTYRFQKGLNVFDQ